MVDLRFDRCRPLRAAVLAGLAGLALCGPLKAQNLDSPEEAEAPVLPSKDAPPPDSRLASRQPLPSGAQPLPPGLMNKTPDLGSLPATTSTPGLIGLSGKETVVKVVIESPFKHVKEHDVRRRIKTTAQRPYDVRTVEDDVRRLQSSKLFAHVEVNYQRVGDNGIIVIYHIIENKTIKYLRFFGQQKVKERHLKKQSGLKVGDPWEPSFVKDGGTKVEDYYREKGFNKISVKILEGLEKDDRGVVYLVNEGQKQKVHKVEFEGNTIASDSRLKTQVQSKPPLLYLFKGEVDRQKIEEDVGRLYEYYRGLGFFRARISRELVFDNNNSWLTVRFIIDEGPRYKLRNVAFVGQQLFTRDQLAEKLKLKAGDYFDRSKLDKDLSMLKDKYGVKGYVFADVQPDQRFSGDPDELEQIDLTYQIAEGRRCIVARVDVQVLGDNPHTRRNTLLNRVSLHPGDLLSTRELRDSERRLKGSGLFKNTPDEGPKIEVHRPEVDQTGLADGPSGSGGFRGQSPDPVRRGAR